MSDAPLPGWYPNPSNSVAEWRWWDGTAWTANVAPREDAPVRRSLEWTDARSAFRDDSLRVVESPNNVWIWLLAFSVYIFGLISGGIRSVSTVTLPGDSTTTDLLLVISAIVGFVPLMVFAHLDGRDLRHRGFEAPSILWMLVFTPLVYFAVRARKLRQVGARSRGPEIAVVIVTLLQVVGVLAAVAIAIYVMQYGG